jgi:ribonuclease VapC
MIAIDSSALIAVCLDEPERDQFIDIMDAAERILVSAGTVIESRMVAHNQGRAALVRKLDELVEAYSMEIVPADPEQTEIAHAGFVAYGKGSGHPAGLNFGDLFSYALAKARGVPLLYKGGDFARTDIAAAVG